MKKSILISILSVSLFLIGCAKDEDETSSAPLEYIDQDLQGKINGEPWAYNMGSVYTWLPNAEYSHDFSIVDSIQKDTCFVSTNQRSKIIFSLGNENPILKVGSHNLLLDWDKPEISKTITFVYYVDKSPWNIIAEKGAYEILSVDTLNKVVSGKIKVNYDQDNFINGNFTLKYCSW